MNDAGVNLRDGLETAWTNFITFLPLLLLFLVILVVGYYIAKLISRGVDKLLERFGFDRLAERGAMGRALERANWKASDIVSMLVFFTLLLFVLQLAFSVFGPNPISTIIMAMIAYLPNIFAALIIIMVAAAVATVVRRIVQATMANVSFGNAVAGGCSFAILAIGVFAALDQLNIAPAIVTGLFYALLAIVVGSSIIAVGVGGIAPMRAQWEKAIRRIEREAPVANAGAPSHAQEEVRTWRHTGE